MKFENKIGPMICIAVKRIAEYKQNHSMRYYKIFFPGATMGATQLHAFKVIRDGKELYLPTHMLKSGDNIWIDQSAFMADGSFILEKKTTKKETCLPENTKIFTPIENIVATEEVIHFRIGTVNIQASTGHTFDIRRNDQKMLLRADELRAGDMLLASISLLTPGNKVLGSDGEFHTIKNKESHEKEM